MKIDVFKHFSSFIVFSLLFLSAPQVFATTNISTLANSQGFSGIGNTTQTNSADHSSSVSVNLNSNGYTGQAAASGFADYGILKVFAYANSGNGSTSLGNATASFSDTMYINATSQLNGTSGTAIVNLKLNYGGAVTGNANAAAYNFNFENSDRSFIFQAQGGLNCTPCSTYDSANSSTQSNIPVSTNYSLAVPFTYGQALTLNLSSMATAQAYIGLSTATMDSSHSFYWAGISQVLDQNANVVSGFNVTSDSGTNYLKDFSVTAVPEPEVYAMLLTGLSLIGLVARRRRNEQI